MKNKFLLFSIAVVLFLQSCSSNTSKDIDIKLVPFAVDNKAGFFDLNGKIVINPQFSNTELFTEGLCQVRNADGKYGYIDESGKYIINPQFKDATIFSEGLAGVVTEGGKCQYVDTKGTIKFAMDSADECGIFSEGLAKYVVGNKVGFIDQSGKVVITPQFDNATFFAEGLAAVTTKGKDNTYQWGYIDKTGKYLIDPQFKEANPFSEGLASVYDGKNYGFIDKEGKYVINPQFSWAFLFKNGLACVGQGGQWGYIDKTGKYIINPQFKEAFDFASNGLALVVASGTNSKYGYIDKQGKYIINPQFDFATPFFNDVALAGSDNDKVGIIDTKGSYVVNPQFQMHRNRWQRISQVLIQYKNQDIIRSDFFDKASLINKFLDGTTGTSFKNCSQNTTSKEINQLHSNDNKSATYSDISVFGNFPCGNSASVVSIQYTFTSTLYNQTPVFSTGGQSIDHYEAVANDNATLGSIEYKISLSNKANGKEPDVLKGLADAIQAKTGGSASNISSNYTTIENGSFIITLSLTNSQIRVDVAFKKALS